jgi:hypothetical protein
VIVGVGKGLTVIVFGAAVPAHPFASVTVRVYVPDELTEIEEEVCPVDHRYAGYVLLELNVVELPWHIDCPPVTVMFGVGSALMVIESASDLLVQPRPSVICTL